MTTIFPTQSTSNSGTSQLTNLTNFAKQLTEIADDLMAKVNMEEQRVKKSQMQESEGWTSVPQELPNLRGGVQLDMKTVQERQVELTQKWASVRTGMKRRKEVGGTGVPFPFWACERFSNETFVESSICNANTCLHVRRGRPARVDCRQVT